MHRLWGAFDCGGLIFALSEKRMAYITEGDGRVKLR